MKQLPYIIFKSALLSALFFATTLSFSQSDKLKLLPGSKLLEYDQRNSTYRLVGNVRFQYQENTMFCDSAYFNENTEIVKAYGKVHINKRDTLNLFCDSLRYNGKTQKAKLWGNVRVRDKEYKLTTDTLEYDSKAGQAHFHHGGKVESTTSSEVLTSRVGYFHPESKNFFFSRNVHYKSEELEMSTDTLRYLYSKNTTYFYGPTDIISEDANMHCESGEYNVSSGKGSLIGNASISREKDFTSGDTLIYNPEEGYSEGKGNVRFVDSLENISFEANYAFNSDSLKYSFLTGNAIAEKKLDSDTLYIHADTLYNEKIDSTNRIKAYHNAKMFSNEFQSSADSILFEQDSNRIELYDSPIVWSNDAELKGEHITLHVNDSVIEKATVINGSSIIMEVEKEQYYNQIYGNDIIALFDDKGIKQATVMGNAITIFYPVDEEKSDSTFTKKRMGMNRLYSSSMRIMVDSNEIQSITYLDEPDGAFYPMDQIKKDEQFIPNFIWKEALRPKNKLDLLKD